VLEAEVRIAADAVVVGGGPAGISSALVLARSGLDVVVLERTHYETRRIGETLIPVIRTSLARLGLADPSAEVSEPSYGVRSVWGEHEPVERSFMFDPYGYGWHVDRRALDASLATAAEERGVRVLRGHRPVGAHHTRGRGWELRLQGDERTAVASARLVVDATGRAAAFARRVGARRIAVDRAVAVFGFFRITNPLEPVALVESVPDGWWYSAPCPHGRLVAAFVTDVDLLGSGARGWAGALQSASHTSERLSAAVPEGSMRTVSATCSKLDCGWGDHWIAVGDAAMAGDPLSGDGVHRALAQSARAMEAFLATGRSSSAAADYRREVDDGFDVHCRRRAAFYARETRWPDAPFWRRRAIHASRFEE
jgi:flavin-dependent dehydrogenase